LDLIRLGPDLGPAEERRRQARQPAYSDDDRAWFVQICQRDLLLDIEPHLMNGDARWLKEILELVGAPPERPTVTQFTRATSPISAEELAVMSVAEIATLLRDVDLNDAVAMQLVDVVAAEPARFAEESTTFLDLPERYWSALIDGLDRAHAQERPFPWRPVLRFIEQMWSHVNDEAEFRLRQVAIKSVM
jgi:hypothetical protein